jgi:hypothetical protein
MQHRAHDEAELHQKDVLNAPSHCTAFFSKLVQLTFNDFKWQSLVWQVFMAVFQPSPKEPDTASVWLLVRQTLPLHEYASECMRAERSPGSPLVTSCPLAQLFI